MRLKMFAAIKKRALRLSVLCLAALMALGAVQLPRIAAAPDRIDIVEMAGVTGAGNNVAFAFDRYVLVAPYAPSADVQDGADLGELDNHFLYLIDTKKPNSEPKKKDLTTSEGQGGKTVYYPTKVVFDPETSVAYVRGTRYEQDEEGIREIDVISYVHLNLDDDGKAVFDQSVVAIDIKGIGKDYCDHAPLDFALAGNGKWLVFTNGASLFTFNIDEGYLYQMDIVPSDKYGEDSQITYLDIDRATNTLAVSWNRKTKDAHGNESNASEISFYRASDHGALDLLKRAYSDDLPAGAYLTPGSNAVITSDEKTGEPSSAFFVTSDGSLCQLDIINGKVSEPVKVIETFSEIAQTANGPASPRLLRLDPSTRILSVVRQGFTAQIRRPAFGKPGRRVVIRSLDTHAAAEEPVMVLAKLGKKNKVVAKSVFTGEEGFDGGLTNTASTEDGQLLVAGYSGTLYSVSLSDKIADATLERVGEIGSRVDRIDYYPSRTSVVAINSFGADEADQSVTSPGSVVIARMGAGSSKASSLLQALMPLATAVAGRAPSIRRPLNIKR